MEAMEGQFNEFQTALNPKLMNFNGSRTSSQEQFYNFNPKVDGTFKIIVNFSSI